jgi:integrase
VVDDLSTHVSSNSMKAGLRKYLGYRGFHATTIEEQRTAQFLREKVGRIDIAESPRDVESKVLPTDTVAQVCRDADEKNRELSLMLRMMYETATRFSGVNNLLWKDVWRDQFSGESLNQHQVLISKDRSKGKVDGVVEVSDHTRQRLQELTDDRDPDADDLVFFPDLKRPSVYTKAWRHFDTYADNIVTHSFRHSRLTHLGLEMYENEGLEYGQIKERLRNYARHTSADTTETYIEIVKEKIRQRSDVMADYRNVKWSQ